MSRCNEALNLRIGVIAGGTVAVLNVIYAIILGMDPITLPSSALPIQNPWFTIMELLIVGIAPAMVSLAVGLHAWAPVERKSYAQLGIEPPRIFAYNLKRVMMLLGIAKTQKAMKLAGA
jgi:hypothetical protein